jgi:NAD(P)-dependent dehydrogenase (short-subunit alcohol dehydrogenase family)
VRVSLEGKVALVTGASSGIGAAIAEAMADAEASVAIVGRSAERLDRVRKRIEERGAPVRAIVADVTEEGAAERLVAETVSAFGRLDCLVNCAGVFTPAPVDVSLELLDAQWVTNVRAPFALAVAALPELRRTKGSILFLSSIAGMIGFPNATAYCATKGAIELLVKSLAVEEGPKGVRVNAIAPGNIETPMNAHLMEDPAYKRAMIEATPLARNGQVEDIAPLAVMLAASQSAFTTGASVLVDGGWAAR